MGLLLVSYGSRDERRINTLQDHRTHHLVKLCSHHERCSLYQSAGVIDFLTLTLDRHATSWTKTKLKTSKMCRSVSTPTEGTMFKDHNLYRLLHARAWHCKTTAVLKSSPALLTPNAIPHLMHVPSHPSHANTRSHPQSHPALQSQSQTVEHPAEVHPQSCHVLPPSPYRTVAQASKAPPSSRHSYVTSQEVTNANSLHRVVLSSASLCLRSHPPAAAV